jgi:lysozyme
MKLVIRVILTLGVLAASIAATAAPASAASLSGNAILGVHTVRAGETLYCIGRAYGVQPWAIAAQNGIGQTSTLYVGQSLAIPDAPWINKPAGPTCTRQFDPGTPPPPPPQCRAFHVVRFGETLSGIAWWYGVNLYTLAARNGIYNTNLIYAGTTLCIP